MRKTLVLAHRELASYFVSPMAYIIGAMFLMVSGGIFFYTIFIQGNEASLRELFDRMAQLMVAAVPLLTMKLISDELRSGTIETLMTAPVTEAEIVLGKFLGVLGLYVILLAMTLVYLVLMALYGQPDTGVAVMGYLGMVLLGAAFIAVGVFASTLTRYQLVAAIIGIAVLAMFTLVMPWMVRSAAPPLNHVAARLNVMVYFQDFSRGVFDLRGAMFFLGGMALFLFLSVKSLESRRWR